MDIGETILSRSILKKVFKEYLDRKEPPIEACGCVELMSRFLLRNDQPKFYERMQEFIDKMVVLGVVIDTENEDIEERYKLSGNVSDFLVLLKYIE